jgi:rhodanese-related sulfurtransferase
MVRNDQKKNEGGIMQVAKKINEAPILMAGTLLLAMVWTFCLATPALAADFPGREKFPDVPYIISEALFEAYEAKAAVIVDVRSTIEYNVIHPVNALHIPVSKMDFVKKVKELRAANAGKKIAFYCNGTTCFKSYIATQKAQQAGISNVFAYDGGIPEWVMVYPDKTLLLGKIVTDPEKQVIPKSEFKKKTLAFEDFKAAAKNGGGVVVDARDAMQRAQELPGMGKTLKIPLDTFIPNFVEKKKNQDKPLFIFDQVGKQVRWLEYYLVENGYENYYFLKGGATAVLKDQKYK